MKKIEETLARAIAIDPTKEFDVLIVVKEGHRINNAREIMTGIWAGRLTGEEIVLLEEEEGVVRVERDGEVRGFGG